MFLYVQSQCELESPPLTSVEVTNDSTGLKLFYISHSISADMSSSLNKVFQLVRNGDLDGLKAFFSTDDTIDLNQVNQSALTPLMVACNRPSVSSDIIDLLIEKGAKVDYQYNYGYSALMKALQVGKTNVEAVKCLIKHGAQVDSKALEVCCEKGNVEVVKVLLQVEGIQDNLISGELSDYKYADMVYSVSHCPFNTAIKYKHIQLVKWLLDSYMVTDIPVGALFSAIESQSSEMVQLLLDHGGTAQVNPTADGETSALMLASYHGNIEIVKMLLEKGAKVNIQNEKKVSALILAADQGNVEVLKQLLEIGADVNLKGEGGSTALLSALLPKQHFVSQQTKVEMVKLLLNHDADVKVRDGLHTALSCAIAMKSTEIINLLLDKDKDLVNQPDLLIGHSYSNPIYSDSPEILELLLKAGANVKDVLNYRGQTLLWSVRHVSIAKLLIDYGVDVNHLDDDDTCALQNATYQCGKDNLIRLLLENGADPTVCADGGKYILEWRKRTSSDTSHAVGEKRFKCEYRDDQ